MLGRGGERWERYQPFMVTTQLNNKMAYSEIEQCVTVSLDKCV